MPRTGARATREHRTGGAASASRQGRGGVSLAPPAYGLEAADRGRNRVVQCRGNRSAAALDAGKLRLAPENGRPLPESVRGDMEASFGADFSPVRIHVGSQADGIGADAFTIGASIYFAPGRYQPGSVHGRELLGHELAHVVQQSTGRVGNPAGDGVALVHDAALEAEADRLGRNAATADAVAAESVRPLGHQVFAAKCVQAKDRTEQIINLMNEAEEMRNDMKKREQAKLDVISVFNKLKKWLSSGGVKNIAMEVGRDSIFYSIKDYLISFFRLSPTPIAVTFLTSDPVENSPGENVALLMDLALAWKHKIVDGKSKLDEYAEQYAKGRERNLFEKDRQKYEIDASINYDEFITNSRQLKFNEAGVLPNDPSMLQSQALHQFIKEKTAKSASFLTKDHVAANPKVGERFPAGTKFGDLRAQKEYQVKAGPSSSTATLLWLLRHVGGVTSEETKSVVFALAFEYWGKGLKHMSGKYHTLFEAVIPLARHIGKFDDAGQEEKKI